MERTYTCEPVGRCLRSRSSGGSRAVDGCDHRLILILIRIALSANKGGGRRRKMYKGAGESWNSPSTFPCPVSLSTLRSFSVSLSLPSTLFLAMFKYVSLALLALSALSAVHGLPLAARSTPPAGWIAGILEVSDSQRAIATYSHPLLSHMTPTTLVTLTSVASSSTTPRSSMIAVTP